MSYAVPIFFFIKYSISTMKWSNLIRKLDFSDYFVELEETILKTGATAIHTKQVRRHATNIDFFVL
jgi:hypothetical protein